MSSVLGYYKKGYTNALSHVFPELSPGDFSKSHWLDWNNRRAFFEHFALAKKFDPEIADSWYSVDPDIIFSFKGGKMVQAYYRGDLISALANVFPHAKFNTCKFAFFSKNYWKEEENRRKFFVDYAELRGLDVTLTSTWYSLTKLEIQSFSNKVDEILAYYNGSLFHAIISLFCNLPFQECKFQDLPVDYWSEKVNHKKMFESYAQDYGFDPLDASAWHNISREDVLSFTGGKQVLAYYKRSHVLALLSLFPSIGLDRSKFDILPRHFWQDVKNRRIFLINFASEHGFDPFKPANWSHILEEVSIQKGASTVLGFYGGDLATALLHLFPEVSWSQDNTESITTTNTCIQVTASSDIVDQSEVVVISSQKQPAVKTGWSDPKREFFISLAQKEGFDPNDPANWYRVREQAVLSHKGATRIMSRYKGNFIEALIQLFPEFHLDPSLFISPPQSYWLAKSRVVS